MYNQLAKIYKDALIQTSSPHSFSRHVWFISPDNDYYGIEKEALTPRDILLLETFLKRVEENQFSMTDTEKWWHEQLFLHQNPDKNLLQNQPKTSRFIHFHFSEPLLHKEEWKEALIAFFDSEIEIVWDSLTRGVIIDFMPEYKEDEFVSFSDIVDTTASDFYTNVKLYIGAYTSSGDNLTDLFHWEEHCFALSMKGRKQRNIHTFEHALPYIVTDHLETEHFLHIKTMFGTILEDEKELLQSVKVYIENNMNVSLTSKKLFMHRNSLQYRIDKFIERTGIDIKNFQGAMAAYLAIIIMENEQKR
ncbi:hypothetical protein AB685_14030 [Bacillus sp. LL01]|uniref:PucR family transcriptional regulator n=1 Tax=Bacillus sp. LL01 TaxID=1665556 RepID=UPI00064D1E57|nr:helix-turn-helix domain-containing protein [Bacillus sp. LL01]KMJ57944.1 hypothetical protein AB685_14030 [Bacillus sp. LL01]